MKDDDALKMMGQIDPVLLEELDLTEQKRRRMSAPMRTGLIAACVCLALLGAVGAAATLNGVFQGAPVHEEMGGVMCDGIELHVEGLTSLPREAFREEFWETVAENEVLCMARDPENGRVDIPLRYLSWEKAQEDMGITLAKNEVLEEMPQGECTIHGPGEVYFWVCGRYIADHAMMVFVDARLFTSEAPSSLVYGWEPAYGSFGTESYIMPDGSAAIIQEMRFTDPYDRNMRSEEDLLDSYSYEAWFVQNGILYTVDVVNSGADRMEEGRALLEEILDAFVQQ